MSRIVTPNMTHIRDNLDVKLSFVVAALSPKLSYVAVLQANCKAIKTYLARTKEDVDCL